MPCFPRPITYSLYPYFATKYLYFQLDMGDCQSVPSRETPPFRRPITLLARGLFRSRTAFGLLNAVRIELNDASILSYEQPPTPPQNVLAVAIGPRK